MDADRFDTLTRLIGSRTSRRMAVGLITTGLLSVAVPEAAAARCSARHLCPECKRCKQHRCRPDASKNNTPCTGGTCQSGVCQTSNCTPVCTNPNGTVRTCGSDSCGGFCGPVGETCTFGRVCDSTGNCTCPADKPVLVSCAAFTGCTDLATEEQNCGHCGDFCAFTCCGGFCVNTAQEDRNCGVCGKVCPEDQPTCCGGSCVNTLSDPGNCGGCAGRGGQACAAGLGCISGFCR
jgi:hypothetical protein